MYTNITLAKAADDHTWEEEHEVWTEIIKGIEKNLTQPLASKRAFIRHKAGQEMTRLGFE